MLLRILLANRDSPLTNVAAAMVSSEYQSGSACRNFTPRVLYVLCEWGTAGGTGMLLAMPEVVG